jgi:hypothetical protein
MVCRRRNPFSALAQHHLRLRPSRRGAGDRIDWGRDRCGEHQVTTVSFLLDSRRRVGRTSNERARPSRRRRRRSDARLVGGDMTGEELAAFAAQVRLECDAALARLDTVAPTLLPPKFARAIRRATPTLARSARADPRRRDGLARSCLLAHRALTQPEARPLLRRQ